MVRYLFLPLLAGFISVPQQKAKLIVQDIEYDSVYMMTGPKIIALTIDMEKNKLKICYLYSAYFCHPEWEQEINVYDIACEYMFFNVVLFKISHENWLVNTGT